MVIDKDGPRWKCRQSELEVPVALKNSVFCALYVCLGRVTFDSSLSKLSCAGK